MRLFSAVLGVTILLVGCSDGQSSIAPPLPSPDAGGSDDDAGVGSVKTLAKCPAGVDFEDLSGKVGVQVKINGAGPFVFFFDTGASTSVFGTKLQEHAAKASVEAAGVTATLTKVTVRDMSTYRLPVDGILGMDFIGENSVTVDYPRLKWWVEPESDEDALLACDHVESKPEEVPYFRKGDFFVKGGIESLDGWLLLDSGASLGGTLKSAFSELDALQSRPSLSGFYTPATIGTFWARLTTLGSVRFGGQVVESVVTRTIDDGLIYEPKFPDGGRLLGLFPSDMLRLFMVTIDPQKEVVRFDAGKNRQDVPRVKYFATGIGLSNSLDTHSTVKEVLAGSAAAEAGVVPGDEVVSIDGHKMASVEPYSRAWALVSSTEGKSVRVVVRHVGADRTLDLETRDLLRPPSK